jgi:hypothetical protein
MRSAVKNRRIRGKMLFDTKARGDEILLVRFQARFKGR